MYEYVGYSMQSYVNDYSTTSHLFPLFIFYEAVMTKVINQRFQNKMKTFPWYSLEYVKSIIQLCLGENQKHYFHVLLGVIRKILEFVQTQTKTFLNVLR